MVSKVKRIAELVSDATPTTEWMRQKQDSGRGRVIDELSYRTAAESQFGSGCLASVTWKVFTEVRIEPHDLLWPIAIRETFWAVSFGHIANGGAQRKPWLDFSWGPSSGLASDLSLDGSGVFRDRCSACPWKKLF